MPTQNGVSNSHTMSVRPGSFGLRDMMAIEIRISKSSAR